MNSVSAAYAGYTYVYSDRFQKKNKNLPSQLKKRTDKT